MRQNYATDKEVALAHRAVKSKRVALYKQLIGLVLCKITFYLY